jgi:hypothetical protein
MKPRLFISIALLAVVAQPVLPPSVGATRCVVPTSALLAVAAHPALPQGTNAPLGKDQVLELVKFKMDSAELAMRIEQYGIDFEPSEEYLETLRKAGAQDVVIQALRDARPKPLTQEQVGELVAGGVPNERTAMLVKQRGIDFVADERYLETLRVAGAGDTLVAALREAGKSVTAQLRVVTSPDAEVYLDGEFQGKAGPGGDFAVKAKPGAHALKISLEGKRDFEQTVTLAAPQGGRIEAPLTDLVGTVRVQTSAGAEVFLDGSNRGRTGQSGQLFIPDVAPGDHVLRVSAEGKREYRATINVSSGQETMAEAILLAMPAPNPVGTVYFLYKDKLLGNQYPVFCDGAVLGMIAGHTYFAARIAEGQHRFWIDFRGATEIDVQQGRQYYLESGLRLRGVKNAGGWVVSLHLVSEEVAHALLPKLEPLQPNQLRDPRAFVPSFAREPLKR